MKKYPNRKARCTCMLNFSTDELVALFEKLLKAVKDLFAWLGILILPEEGEYDYPEGPVEEI